MFSRRLLVENIFSLAALQLLNYATPLITLPYLTRVLHPPHFGLLAYAQGIVLYFDLFTDFGFNFSATRAISMCRHDPATVARIFWSTLAAKVLLMMASGVALTLLIIGNKGFHSIAGLLAANYLYVIGTTFFPVWYFQGLERIKVAALFVGIGRLLAVPALLCFVKGPDDLIIAGAIQASVELTASVLSGLYIYHRMTLEWCPPTWADIMARLREGWPLFLSASAWQVSASSTTVILGALRGQVELGFYSAADKLIKAACAALNPIGQALYPRISAIQIISSQKAFKLIRKTLWLVGLLGLVLSIVAFVLSGSVCRWLLPVSFTHSALVLQCMAPLPLFFGLMSVFGTQTMLVFGLDALFLRIMLGSMALGLPLTALFARSKGAVGAALASDLVSLAVVVSMIVILLAKRFPIWKETANYRTESEVA